MAIPSPRAVILTALRVEYEAVRAHLVELHPQEHPKGTIYESGVFVDGDGKWEVLIAEIGAGNEGAAAEGERAIGYFDPAVVLFVGVAGGIKDVRRGDVVASTKIYNFAAGKAKDVFLPRPDSRWSSYRLEQRARYEARHTAWRARIKPTIFEAAQEPQVFTQPIASGEVVVASVRSAVYEFLVSQYSDAVAVEMEGHGFLHTIHINQPVEAIVVRGISDLVADKAEADAAGWQEIASAHAAAFAFQLLAALGNTHGSLPLQRADSTLSLASQAARKIGSTPFQAPPLPTHYVERVRAVSEIVRELVQSSSEQGVLAVTALHGSGGVGKTTVAAAVASHPEVQSRFPDGVFWATLGQEPDCLSHLVEWVQSAFDAHYRPTTISAATRYLRTLLRSAKALLVLDDVWDPEHAKVFLTGGPQCRLLITTRRAAVSDSLGAQMYPLDAMTPDEALTLLRTRVERTGRSLSAESVAHATVLAREIGYLPLALEIVGALVARGYGWEEVTAELKIQEQKVERPGARLVGAHAKIEACLRISLDWLRREDLSAWRCFAWLGVLADDTPLTPALAATLWGISEGDAAHVLHALADEAILQRRRDSFAVHDLMHDMARRLLFTPEPHGVGVAPADAHRQLVAHYSAKLPGQDWDRLQPDGYIHTRLIWHLRQSGDHNNAAHALLTLTTPEGENGWYHARQRLGQTAGFLEDVHAVWKDERQKPDGSLTRQLWYALIVSSVYSLAETIAPGVVPMLVKHGAWTPAEAFDRIRHIVKPDHLVVRLTELLSVLPSAGGEPDSAGAALREEILREAIETTRMRVSGYRKALLLAHLSHHVDGPRRVELATEAVAHAGESSHMYVELAEALPSGPWLQTLLRRARSSHRDRLRDIIANKPAVPSPDHRPTESHAIEQFEFHLKKGWSYDLTEALDFLPYLPEPRDRQIRAVVNAAFRTLSRERAGEMLTRLIPMAPRTLCQRIAEELLSQDSPPVGVFCLSAVLDDDPHVRAERFDKALARLSGLTEKTEVESAMSAIVRTCPVEVVHRALRCYQRIGDIRERAGAIFMLAPHLRGGLPPAIVRTLTEERGAGKQIVMLTRMVAQLSQAIDGRLLNEFVREAAQMVSEWWLVEAMTLLLLRLHEPDELAAMLQTADHLRTPDLKSRIIGRISLRLARLGFVGDAIAATSTAPLAIERGRILADVVADLAADAAFQPAEEIAAAIAEREERDRACSLLALHLAAAGHLSKAREIASKLQIERWRSLVLPRLDLAEAAKAVPPSSASVRSGGETAAALEVPAPDDVRNAVQLLLDKGLVLPELHGILTALDREDIEAARKLAAAFWRTDVGGGKTFLEVASVQPRPAFLAELQTAFPLMTLVLRGDEPDDIAAAIHSVGNWWP